MKEAKQVFNKGADQYSKQVSKEEAYCVLVFECLVKKIVRWIVYIDLRL